MRPSAKILLNEKLGVKTPKLCFTAYFDLQNPAQREKTKSVDFGQTNSSHAKKVNNYWCF